MNRRRKSRPFEARGLEELRSSGSWKLHRAALAVMPCLLLLLLLLFFYIERTRDFERKSCYDATEARALMRGLPQPQGADFVLLSYTKKMTADGAPLRDGRQNWIAEYRREGRSCQWEYSFRPQFSAAELLAELKEENGNWLSPPDRDIYQLNSREGGKAEYYRLYDGLRLRVFSSDTAGQVGMGEEELRQIAAGAAD